VSCARSPYAYDVLGADGVGITTSYSGRYLGDAAFAPGLAGTGSAQGRNICPSHESALLHVIRDSRELWRVDLRHRAHRDELVDDRGAYALAEYPLHLFSWWRRLADDCRSDGQNSDGRPEKIPNGVHDALAFIRKLYFDVANAAGPSALPAVRGMADPTHILFGSDYPMIPVEWGIDYLARAGLSHKELFAIERGNALALLPRLRGS